MELGGFTMERYSYELKLKIVRENRDGYGRKYLSKKYNIPEGTIHRWIEQYQSFGSSGIEKSMGKTKYSGEFKLSVLKYRQINQLSYRETSEHFNIKNYTTIANWKRKYYEEGIEGLHGFVGKTKKAGDTDMSKKTDKERNLTKSESEELIKLRNRNEYLEAENLYLKKLDALIREKKSQTKKKHK